jgi:Ca2+-binding EF-hand superfamily protein
MEELLTPKEIDDILESCKQSHGFFSYQEFAQKVIKKYDEKRAIIPT